MITKEQAVSLRLGQYLVSTTVKDKSGSFSRCRVNGSCQTWKRTPEAFRLPVKHGLSTYFYITPENAAGWAVA